MLLTGSIHAAAGEEDAAERQNPYIVYPAPNIPYLRQHLNLGEYSEHEQNAFIHVLSHRGQYPPAFNPDDMPDALADYIDEFFMPQPPQRQNAMDEGSDSDDWVAEASSSGSDADESDVDEDEDFIGLAQAYIEPAAVQIIDLMSNWHVETVKQNGLPNDENVQSHINYIKAQAIEWLTPNLTRKHRIEELMNDDDADDEEDAPQLINIPGEIEAMVQRWHNPEPIKPQEIPQTLVEALQSFPDIIPLPYKTFVGHMGHAMFWLQHQILLGENVLGLAPLPQHPILHL